MPGTEKEGGQGEGEKAFLFGAGGARRWREFPQKRPRVEQEEEQEEGGEFFALLFFCPACPSCFVFVSIGVL